MDVNFTVYKSDSDSGPVCNCSDYFSEAEDRAGVQLGNISNYLSQDFASYFARDSYYQSCEALGQPRLWWIFLISSILSWLTLYSVLGVWNTVKWCRSRSSKQVLKKRAFTIIEVDPSSFFDDSSTADDVVMMSRRWTFQWYHVMEREANRIINCQTLTGRVVAIIGFCVAMVSFGIYCQDVADTVPDLEVCRAWTSTVEWQVDFVCNLFFLVYFVLRYCASSRKFVFLAEAYSIVDYFTIPPSITAIILDRNWSGLRFLRVLHILSIPDVMQYVGILKTRTQVTLTFLICRLACIILVGSGVFHLTENFNAVLEHGHSYWKFLYFSVVTISTVGYGDIAPVTAMGRAFDCIYILGTIALFASSLPEVGNMVRSKLKYGGGFKPETGLEHVVVCGHITFSIANRFLESFFNSAYDTSYLCVVFVSNQDPDLEMEALLRNNFAQVEYLQGDVLNSLDLARAAMQRALACLIIADKKPEQTETEDATNVLRVISIKNFHATTRIIAQIYHKRNHIHLTNLSSWNSLRGDTIVSLFEIKMGLLAKSCIAPGFSTMVSNLMRANPDIASFPYNFFGHHDNQELDSIFLYHCTGKNQLLMQKLSDYYTDMSFSQVARHCYAHLGVLLIGLFEKPTSWVAGIEFGDIMINPSAISVTTNHMGIFVAYSQDEVDKAWYYCDKCHINTKSPNGITPCLHNSGKQNPYILQERNPMRRFWLQCRRFQFGGNAKVTTETHSTRTVWQGDGTQIAEKRDFILEDIVIPIPSVSATAEIYPALSAGSLAIKSQESGFLSTQSELSAIRKHHWVPSRSFQEAKAAADPKSKLAIQTGFSGHIVICVFAKPNASPLDLSELVMPLRSGDIPFEHLKEIVLLGNTVYLEKEWSTLSNLPKITVVRGNPLERTDLEMVSINECDTCVVIQSKSGHSKDEILDDREVILSTLNIKAMKYEEEQKQRVEKPSVQNLQPSEEIMAEIKKRQKLITNIEHDENIKFLERDRTNAQRDIPLYLSSSFVSGAVFLESVLDSLLVTSYFEPLACSLIRSMVHGRAQMGIMSENTASGNNVSYIPCPTVQQGLLKVIRMSDPMFAKYVNGPYRNVVLESFANGMVCIGIGRLDRKVGLEKSVSMTYPLTNPMPDLIMRESDDLYLFASYLASPSRHNESASPQLPPGCRRTILVRKSEPKALTLKAFATKNMIKRGKR
ncbi:calcium-activated potassium channel slo-1-like isoform X2 [Paramacrobiotus metropolitanus]|uniref:calcium-activated potassium channel slo-1-like isoform X2 n=1 Tax=Paramacrobiotus metropolitanus TaxID=2943436 RepID=UPI002445B9B2|nr:calcium-activated potassium channel slo-1-like isoform X2 [Paramacrobiotus metropolitanus]